MLLRQLVGRCRFRLVPNSNHPSAASFSGFGSHPEHVASQLQFMPMVIEQEGPTQRVYDIYSRLLKDRIVCIMGPVTDQLANGVIAQLLFLQSESTKKPVHIYLNSPGGSVTAGLAIYDTMQYMRPVVNTWCIGQAASMGSLLLAAGTPGRRYSLPNARIMTHQPHGQVGGQASDIAIHAEEILKLRKTIYNMYEKHTGRSMGEIEKTLDRDRFMSAEEAKEFGLIDQIVRPHSEKE